MTTAKTPAPDDRFVADCLRYLDGEMSGQAFTEFHSRLDADPALQQRFVELNLLSETIAEASGSEHAEEALAMADLVTRTQVIRSVTSKDLKKVGGTEAFSLVGHLAWQTARTHALAIGSVAALLLIGGVLLFTLSPSKPGQPPKPAASTLSTPSGPDTQPIPNPAAPPIVASLTASYEAVWSAGSADGALTPGSPLRAGKRLTLMQGFAEIKTNHGAIAIIEGPASIELLENPNAIQLNQGKLVGLCHTERSKGFLVRTDYADITDLGTEFAVKARPDGVDTTVFVGAVEVTTPDGGVQPLTASQTARLTLTNGTRDLRIEESRSEDFTRRLPRQPVILSATTNNTAYRAQVVPQGVYEDAKAYLNRDYELNGVNADGIPTVLFDGDRVLMDAHEDQIKRLEPDDPDLHLEIMLGAPADLYVLMNKQSGVPGWLKRDYEDTGLEVGLDESEDKRTSPLAIGPGKGIDATLRVWKMKTVADKKVTLDYGRVESVFIVIAVPTQGGGGAADP
ncbi:MAG: FecR domain-containing protein [Planctomycetota bacterium]